MKNNDLLCPKCGSLARDRRLWNLIIKDFLKTNIKALDFSPSRCIARKMKQIQDIDYLSSDLSGNFIADYNFDITNIDLPTNTIDLVVCYHILEHIPNDITAMSELYRILKISGKAIIQTPFKNGDIYEDYTITNPKEREVHFGQDDHVRVYSVNGLTERLLRTGFSVDTRTFNEDVYHGLLTETVLIVTKS